MKNYKISTIYLLLSLLISVLLYLSLPNEINDEARMTLSISAGAISLWIFEPIPFSMTAIIVLVLLPMTKSVSLDLMLSAFSSPAIFLIIGGMMLAAGVEQTVLGKRMAYYLLYWVGDKRGGILIGLLIISQLMAIFIPSASVRTTMLIPIVLSVLDILGVRKGDIIGKQMMMTVSFGSTISGTAILPAAIANVIAADLIHYYLGKSISYLDWMLITFPIWILMIPLAWWILHQTYPVISPPEGIKLKMKALIEGLGPVSVNEKRIILILIFVSMMWITENYHGWPPAIPAFIGVVLLAFPGIRITDWEKLLKIKFGPIIILGVTLSLGRALDETKAIDALSQWLKNDLTTFLFSNSLLAVITVAVFTQIFHKITSNVTTAVVAITPVVIALSAQSSESLVLLLTVLVGVHSLFGFIFVVETIPNVLVHGTGWVTQKDFIKPGLWLTVVSIGVTALLAVTWWPWLGLM